MSRLFRLLTASGLMALFASATAAPVPEGKLTTKELDKFYSFLGFHDTGSTMFALLPLSKKPGDQVVPYLAEKLRPLVMTEKEARQIIDDLGSDDEKKVNAAFEKTRYFDTRLALTPQEAFKDTPHPVRCRLAAAWEGFLPNEYEGSQVEIQKWMLRKPDGTLIPPGGFSFKGKMRGSHTFPMTVAEIDSLPWKQASRTIILLEHFGTADAVQAIKRMATGHPDARPTKEAKAALERLETKNPPKPDVAKLFDDLTGFDAAKAARAMLVMAKHADESVAFLKTKCVPFKLSEERCRELLKQLGSDDEKTWKAAKAELEYFDPRLAFDLEQLYDAVPDVPARVRFTEIILDHGGVDIEYVPTITLVKQNEGGFSIRCKNVLCAVTHKVEHLHTREIRKIALGVQLLRYFATPEAIEILDRMSDGHPDVGPTRTAKFILKDLKGK